MMTAREARAEILAAHPGTSVQVRRLDLADLSSVRDFTDALTNEARPLDLLVNNAGVMFPPVRHETLDGFDCRWAATTWARSPSPYGCSRCWPRTPRGW